MIEHATMLATFAASGFLLVAAHNLADHVTGQCDWQAANKAAPTREEVAAGASPHRGWRANLAHVAQYHLTLMVQGFLAWLVLPLHWSVLGVVSSLGWSAVTHALLDRRWPVRWILERTGSSGFARLNAGGLNGMYAADQALHHLALAVSATLLTVLQ
ncbi:hypothetical protein [Amycolatopsis sp. NPDC004079]|uniref:hypothetical protein n=1 Tax=Amycolatopsis sp. NPDC004079 TaxID=3154549 RepID=UPI0033B6250F